ncbi:unnamed protein product, partial [Amoebophrya sp. A120]|eukprot:GSA120T00021512001.1
MMKKKKPKSFPFKTQKKMSPDVVHRRAFVPTALLVANLFSTALAVQLSLLWSEHDSRTCANVDLNAVIPRYTPKDC